MQCPKCGAAVQATYREGHVLVAECYNKHMWNIPMQINASQRLKTVRAFSSDMDYQSRMQALCDLIDEPNWMTLTASLLKDPNLLTASQKVEALDLWKKIKDLGMVKKISEFLAHIKSMAEKLSTEFGIEIHEIVEAFQTKPMLAFFKTIKFSISVLLKPLKAFAELYKDGILKVFHELHNTKVFQQLHSGALKVDDFLDQYPIMRRLAGLAVAGLLLWVWLSGNFSGSPAIDMDLTGMLKAALQGHWSAAELFTSKEGLAMFGLLVAGLTTPWPSPLWLSAALPFNLLVALCYTAFKHLKGENKVVQKIKQHMKFSKL